VITEELDEWDSLGIGENSLGYGNGDAENLAERGPLPATTIRGPNCVWTQNEQEEKKGRKSF
jgi:hypothetical protein